MIVNSNISRTKGMFICTTGNETEPRLKKPHRYYNVNGQYRKQVIIHETNMN